MKSMNLRCVFFLLGVLIFSTMLQAQSMDVQYPGGESLKQRIERIIKTSHKNIVYDSKLVEAIKVSSLKSTETDAEYLLSLSLKSTGLTFKKMEDGSYVIKIDEEKKTSVPQQKTSGKGSLSGTVLDEKGLPITGATVIVPGTTIGTTTDLDGKYLLSHIPSGTTTIQISFMSYETLQVKDVKIAVGKATPLDVVLKESTQQLGEVVVTATYGQASATGLYAKQKNMATLSDGISADMIKKTSDNNVAQVLKRVSGVTIDNGKYVTVRGMSERYNNVQLNGASLPSTEPNRRNFAFDVIPSGLVDNVTINKTFTPDMPGEFTEDWLK